VSALQQSLLISGSIFVVVMLSTYGRREYSTRQLARPLVLAAVFGYSYLKVAPTQGVDYVVYAVGIAVGVGFALMANVFTRVERDVLTGRVMTMTGAGFVATWLLAVGVRIVFIALSEHNHAFRSHLGDFMLRHDILESAIAPFFVLMALSTVLARIALVALRVDRLPQPVAEAAQHAVAV
jgi:hypothetical protein